jgi:hypothetical protein
MSVYQSDPDAAPDADFEPGVLQHLVVGNTGRMLDPRRTPVSIAALRPEVGCFVLRIEGFEDRGALWELPYEKVGNYQFVIGAGRAPESCVAEYQAAIARFDRSLTILCAATAARATAARIEGQRELAATWLIERSSFLAEGGALPDPSTRRGDPRLQADLTAYLGELDLGDMETAFARQFVSGPHSGELVKGHQVVIAELGLAPYEGTMIRDPALFDGGWSREHRARHVIARMAFLRAVFGHLEMPHLSLYRGLSAEGPLAARPNHTFVSASFSQDVARSHFEMGTSEATRVLMHQAVPVERVVMTYYETAAMNEQFLEAEAVLLHDGGNRAF